MVSNKFCSVILLSVIGILPFLDVNAQQEWSRWKRQLPPHEWNPWILYTTRIENFDKYTYSKKMNAYGEYVKGFTVPMYQEDTNWDREWGEYPQWDLRRINCFLGVPYAEPPIGRYRFQVENPCSLTRIYYYNHVDFIVVYILVGLPVASKGCASNDFWL